MTLDPDHIDWSATGAMLAALIALVALWYARRAANASERSAGEAKRVADAEVDRRHDELDPHPKATFSMEPSRNHGGQSLFASLTVDKPCRIVGVAVAEEGGRRPLAIPLPVKANMPVRIHIEDLPEGREEPITDHLSLRIWTPADIDDVTAWACPCTRPKQHGDDQTAGHWEHTIPVKDVERESFIGGAWA